MSEQGIRLLMCNVSINALPPSQSRILRLTLELRLKLELFVFCPVAHLALLSWTQQLDSQFPCGWKRQKNSWWKRNSPKCSRYQIIQTWQFFPCTTAPFFIPPRYCLLALLLCAVCIPLPLRFVCNWKISFHPRGRKLVFFYSVFGLPYQIHSSLLLQHKQTLTPMFYWHYQAASVSWLAFDSSSNRISHNSPETVLLSVVDCWRQEAYVEWDARFLFLQRAQQLDNNILLSYFYHRP